MSYNRYETERLIRESEEFVRYLDSLQREGERLLESMRRHGIEIHHREPEAGKDIVRQAEAFNEKLKREGAI
jgi:hypothetical protein